MPGNVTALHGTGAICQSGGWENPRKTSLQAGPPAGSIRWTRGESRGKRREVCSRLCWRWPLLRASGCPGDKSFQRCSSVWLFWFSLNWAVSPSCGLPQLKTRALVKKALRKCCVYDLDWDLGCRDRPAWRRDRVRAVLMWAHWLGMGFICQNSFIISQKQFPTRQLQPNPQTGSFLGIISTPCKWPALAGVAHRWFTACVIFTLAFQRDVDFIIWWLLICPRYPTYCL